MERDLMIRRISCYCCMVFILILSSTSTSSLIRRDFRNDDNCFVFPSFCTEAPTVRIAKAKDQTFVLPYKDTSLMSMVLLHGELYEEYVMQNIIPLLQMIIESDSKKNDVILLDIGANTGAWTIGLADKFDAPTLIYAFDPFREYLDCLEYSLQLNEFSSTNFVLMDMMISNENYHVIPIFKASGNYRSSWTENTLLGFRSVFEQNNSNSLAVRSLDDLYMKGEFACPSFIRFDIDTDEFEALLGSQEVLSECQPLLLISVPCRSLVEPLIKYLQWVGYRLAWVPSVECVQCYASDWMSRDFPNQRGSPYLVAYPPSDPLDLAEYFPSFLKPIPVKSFFVSQLVHYRDVSIDLLNIRISFRLEDEQVDFFTVQHANETTMNRCERVQPNSYRHISLVDPTDMMALDHPRDLDLSRIELIRKSDPTRLADASYLENLMPQLGFNTELSFEQPQIVRENGGGLLIWQYPNQFSKYLALLATQRISSYLEIGCRWGGTFVFTNEFLKKFQPITRSIAIDLIDSPVQEYCASQEETEFYRMDSQSEEFRQFIENSPLFDLILIDGDHSYEGVRRDYELCRGLGKILVFHDVASHVCPGVARFWNELKEIESDRYDFYEFVDQYEEVWKNMHILFLGIGMAIRKEL